MERLMVLTTIALLIVFTSALTNRKAGKGQQEFLATSVLVVGK